MNTHREQAGPNLDDQADPRLEAFASWLLSLEACDWRGGLQATRELRALGVFVCLCPTTKPAPGDRMGA